MKLDRILRRTLARSHAPDRTVRYVEIHTHHRNALLAQQDRRRFDGHDPKSRYSSEQTLRPEAASGPYIRCLVPDPARRTDVQRLQHAVLDPTPILRPEIEKIRELPFVLIIGISLIRPEASASVDVRMLRVHCQHSICRSGTCTFQLMIVPCHSRIGHGQRLIPDPQRCRRCALFLRTDAASPRSPLRGHEPHPSDSGAWSRLDDRQVSSCRQY